MKNSTAICTIACGNYLPLVRLLADSLVAHNPGLPLFLLLIPEYDTARHDVVENLHLLQIEDLPVPGIEARFALYDRKQLSASLKPTLLKYLLQRGYTSVVFLDPDMLVTASLTQVIATVAEHALTVTPHVLSPEATCRIPDFDKSLLRMGMFNAGFIGVSHTSETMRFLSWWEQRLADSCLNQPGKGMHYDQKWLDHALGFVSDLHVLRDPGVNAAYWNLMKRHIEFDGQQYRVDGELLKCMHLSGFAHSTVPRASCYFPEIEITQLGPLSTLFYRYAESLSAMGWADRSRVSVSNKFPVRNGDDCFESALTSADIQHLGKIGMIRRRAASVPVPACGSFIPVIDFPTSGIKTRHGWSYDEDWGTWSQGTYSDLLISTPAILKQDLQISFLVHGFVRQNHPMQEVDVFLNGEFIAGWRLGSQSVLHTVCVSQAACSHGMIVMGFHMLNPASPYSLGVSDDKRVLGIGLQAVRIDPLCQGRSPVLTIMSKIFGAGMRQTRSWHT